MKKFMVAGSIVVFIALVIVISSKFMDDEALLHDGHIPDNIGNYFLTNKIEGDEAKQILHDLHVTEAALDGAYVLEYQTQSGSYALVWISESDEEGLKTTLFEDMKKFIETNQLYANHSEKMISGRTVQYGFGMERDNYYFVNENRFIWVATFEDKREIFIKNAVKIF